MDDQTRQAARLWTLAQPAVSAFVTAVVRDFKDRDDVLQDIAVAAIESFEAYDPQRPFVPWAMGVARNQVGLYLRRRQRDRVVLDPEAVECLAVAFAEVAEPEWRRLDALATCLQRLDAKSRELCRLRYDADLKPAAIADQIGMSPNAVAKALQRIRDQLRACIHRTVASGGA